MSSTGWQYVTSVFTKELLQPNLELTLQNPLSQRKVGNRMRESSLQGGFERIHKCELYSVL